MKRISYLLGIGLFGLLVFFAGATHAEACTLANPSLSGSGPAPVSATLSVGATGCQAGDQIQLQIQLYQVTQHTINETVPANSTGNHTLTYNFTAGETPLCSAFNGNNNTCSLSLIGRVGGSTQFNTALMQGGTMSYACGTIGCNNEDFVFPPFSTTWPQVSGGGGGGSTVTASQMNFARLQNPIQYDNIPDVIRQFITIVFVIGIPLVAMAIIYAGFLLVTAGGSQDKLKKGKQALLAGVIGGAILLGAWVIAEAIQGTVDQIRGV